MFKRQICIYVLILLVISQTSCGGMNAGEGNRAASEGAVSVQAVKSVSTPAVSGQSVDSRNTADADSERGDRIDRSVEPAMDVDKQIEIIAKNKDVWNMGKENQEEDFPEAYYVDKFQYALTDLDQDGFLEILVFAMQGTGHFTNAEIYEVDKEGKSLMEWNIIKEGLAEEEDVMADFFEYPMDAYYDKALGSYHYMSSDHVHAWAAAGSDYLLDMEAISNTLRIRIITYSAYEPDGKYESEEDLKLKTEYFDSEGKKISEKESREALAAYYQGMEQRYLFYTPYSVKSKKLQKADEEYMEEFSWELEDSWYQFAIEEIRRDSEYEASLPVDQKKQIRTILKKKNGLEEYCDDTYTFLEYAVTDFDRDGKLELTVASIQGTGRFCYYSIYEVEEPGKKLVEWNQKTQQGYSQADICSTDEVTTYTNKSSGQIYYMFKDYVHISAEENYVDERSLYFPNNAVKEDGETSKSKLKKMKKGKQRIGWRNGYGYNINRMNEDFLYDEMVASWKAFDSEKLK